MMLILGIALVAAVLAAAVVWYQKKRMYQAIDRMLDALLAGKPVSFPQMREGELSALAHKACRIAEKTEREIHGAQEEKEQVKRLISNMSHQLKTPLANVCMYRELLEEETDHGKQRDFHQKMKKQLEKIDWILGSLFKMVKLEQDAIAFEIEEASLRQTLLRAVNAVYAKAEKKEIAIACEPFEDFCVYHNSKWTAEVFANLLENAVKYTGRGGQIRIEVNRMQMYTEIRFEDNGIGIRQEELTDIFKRFYRSKDVEGKEGSGIGLYISRLIVEREKGYVVVKSEYGSGTCFSVFLQNCQN